MTIAGRRLRVRDIFQLANGQVVFAGELDGDASLVGKGTWRLEIKGEARGTLSAIGEMMPERRNPNAPGAGQRAVAFEGPIDVEEARRNLAATELIEF